MLEVVLQQPDAAPLSLVRDLFRAETEFSREAWCIDNRVITLAEIMLTRGGRASLMDFLQGKCQSFDASMACGCIRIDRRLAEDLLDEATRLLRKCGDDRERKLLETGRETFAELAFGSGGSTSLPTAETKPHKLRWYQPSTGVMVFSIFLVGFFVCLSCYLSYNQSEHNRRLEALKAIHKMGGEAYRDFKWKDEVEGEFLEIDLRNARVTDSDLDYIITLNPKKRVLFGTNQVSKEGLAKLQQALPKCKIVVK